MNEEYNNTTNEFINSVEKKDFDIIQKQNKKLTIIHVYSIGFDIRVEMVF